MALNKDAVYTAAKGYIFTAPIDTTAPTVAQITGFDSGTPAMETFASDGITPQTWDIVGHTARDELPVFGYEGGDVETRGTWQAEVIKTVVTEPASDYVTFNVHQFDKSNMEFYYGQTSSDADPNIYSVTESGVTAVERALLIVIVDGTYKLGFYAPSTEIRREDSIELAVDEFAYMPLRATLTKSDVAPVLFSWINVGASV